MNLYFKHIILFFKSMRFLVFFKLVCFGFIKLNTTTAYKWIFPKTSPLAVGRFYIPSELGFWKERRKKYHISLK